MKNKILLLIVVFLIPIAVISFQKSETNFQLEENRKLEVKVRLKNEETDQIVEIPLEEYIIGVVAAEMPASFNMEALKAQAVASRTFAIERLDQKKDEYDLKDSISDQAYITKEKMKVKWQNDYSIYLSKITQAVEETAGEILTYEEKPIKAFYFAMSNGKTENAENVFKESYPYLTSVDSKWDNESLNKFNTDIYIPKSEFCEKLNINCKQIKISNIHRNTSNHIETLSINDKTFTGVELRKKLQLRSTDMNIQIENNIIKITTTGYGHGVGMSQYGANGMAKDGNSYKQILTHYYKGTKITTI